MIFQGLQMLIGKKYDFLDFDEQLGFQTNKTMIIYER